MPEFFINIGKKILEYPIESLLLLVGAIIVFKIFLKIIRYLYADLTQKNIILMKITLPRTDSQKDREKQVEKDFREKIAIMEQLYRNLHELRELNLKNMIMSRIFHRDTISFELIIKNKEAYFYVTSRKEYQELIEKQITSYYTDADIQIEKPYEITKKDYKTLGFFVYEKRKFWFPIRTFKTIENDPLNDITNVLSKLSEDEGAFLQILLRPIGDKWAKKSQEFGEQFFKGKEKKGFLSRIPIIGALNSLLIGLVFGYEDVKKQAQGDQGGGYVRMLQTKEEVAKQIGEKATGSGFETVIRVLATSKTKDRCRAILNNINLAFNLFTHGEMNWFQTRRIVPLDSLNSKILINNYKKRYPHTFEKFSIMCPQELASIYHFPNSLYNYTPIIKWLSYRVLPAPVDMPTEGIILGYNSYRGVKREVRITRKDRTRHHYCIGKSGTGKSNFLSFIARQDIINGDGCCVIDPHGDLIDEIVDYIPKERAKDVIIFNPADMDRPMGLNILEAKTPEQQDLASSQATEIFIKLFGDEIFGPRIQHYFRNACLTLMEDEDEGATLIDVPRIFVDDDFMKYKVSKVKNPVVKSFWDHEYSHTGERERQEMIPYFSAKFGPFITNSIMRNTIGQPKSAFNFREVMDNKKVLLINLSKGKIGDLNTQLLGLVIVARIQMAAMSRTDIPEPDRKDFYLYVDEFQNFATDSFCSILSEARKYHLCLIMAHQYIKQLEKSKFGQGADTAIRDAVFGNVGTMMSFKVGADDAEYLAKEYAPVLSEQDVIGISNYKAYIKLNINNTTSRPFSLETVYDTSNKNEKVGKIIREYSKLKYGRKKEFVEQEIKSRIGIEIGENNDTKMPPLPTPADLKG